MVTTGPLVQLLFWVVVMSRCGVTLQGYVARLEAECEPTSPSETWILENLSVSMGGVSRWASHLLVSSTRGLRHDGAASQRATDIDGTPLSETRRRKEATCTEIT